MLWWRALVFFNQGMTRRCCMDQYCCIVESDWFSSPLAATQAPPIATPQSQSTGATSTSGLIITPVNAADHTVGPIESPPHSDCHTSGAGQEIAGLFALLILPSLLVFALLIQDPVYLPSNLHFSEIQILWSGRPLPMTTYHSYHSSMSILLFLLPVLLQIQPTQ